MIIGGETSGRWLGGFERSLSAVMLSPLREPDPDDACLDGTPPISMRCAPSSRPARHPRRSTKPSRWARPETPSLVFAGALRSARSSSQSDRRIAAAERGSSPRMPAIAEDRCGPADVLELRTVDRPRIRSTDVLTEVDAASVDRGVAPPHHWHAGHTDSSCRDTGSPSPSIRFPGPTSTLDESPARRPSSFIWARWVVRVV